MKQTDSNETADLVISRIVGDDSNSTRKASYYVIYAVELNGACLRGGRQFLCSRGKIPDRCSRITRPLS